MTAVMAELALNCYADREWEQEGNVKRLASRVEVRYNAPGIMRNP